MKNIILVVDDDPLMLSVMSKVLSPYYKVRIANSGQRALEIVDTTPKPALILLDVMMPDINGFDVLKQLNKNKQVNNIPVIFVTGLEADSDEEKGIALGAVDYISKPISPAILLARVKNHLALKQTKDFLRDKNTFLEAEITRRMQENQIIQDVSIRALAHLAETRDPETGAHILRTQKYVNLLANQLQSDPSFDESISDEYITLLSKSAPLHDIGKVGIPDSILLKKGTLSSEEFDIMKRHSTYGVQAIEAAESDIDITVDFLILAKEIAHYHHEHWNGNGYPEHLSGLEIPLSARIMALADVFDALISKRIYKPAMPYDEARDIILAGRGTQFDPNIVDAFSHCYAKFIAIANLHQDETP